MKNRRNPKGSFYSKLDLDKKTKKLIRVFNQIKKSMRDDSTHRG